MWISRQGIYCVRVTLTIKVKRLVFMMREGGQLGSPPKPVNIADKEQNGLTLISEGIIYVCVLIEYSLRSVNHALGQPATIDNEI